MPLPLANCAIDGCWRGTAGAANSTLEGVVSTLFDRERFHARRRAGRAELRGGRHGRARYQPGEIWRESNSLLTS
jgi:hypothetical protein